MISTQRLSLLWSVGYAVFGIVFWLWAVLAVIMPTVFLPMGLILPIVVVMLVVFLALTGALAGKSNIERTQDEGFQSDSNRACKFGFTVAWIVYLVAWLVVAQGWMSSQAILPVMGGVTGGSYCLFLGVTGLRGWHETRYASD